MEVVLPSGQLVTATPKNSYSDLFFAIDGGNGQFGTVTKFFVLSYPTPSRNQLASVRFEAEDMATAHANIAAWYKNNKDPYSLVYFANIYSPGAGQDAANPANYGVRSIATMIRMQDDANPAQLDFAATFAPLLAGLNSSVASTPVDVPYSSVRASVSALCPDLLTDPL